MVSGVQFSMSRFVDKLKAGVVPDSEDWVDHLKHFHRSDPGLTPAVFSDYRTIHKKNSYQLLAETLSADAAEVLDLACGDGHLASYIRVVAPRARVTGLDMSEGELARARVLHPEIEFVEAQAQSMPFENSRFNHVVCHMAFMLMLPVEPVVAEIGRVLKPGGAFSAVLGAPPSDDFMIEVRKLCVDFVNARLPARQNSLTGDPRVSTVEGLRELFSRSLGFEPLDRIHEIHLEITTSPDGVWKLMRDMYFVSLLEEDAKMELRERVLDLSRKRSKFGRHIHFEYAMKMIRVNKTNCPSL